MSDDLVYDPREDGRAGRWLNGKWFPDADPNHWSFSGPPYSPSFVAATRDESDAAKIVAADGLEERGGRYDCRAND